MKDEIRAGVVFLVSLVRRRSQLHQEKIEEFGEKLTAVLYRKYQNHWYPANPSKGQAYRCIRINRKQKTDPFLLLACQDCELEYNQLRLPKEITLWIDPQEVCCRCGEGCLPFTVAQFAQDSKKMASLDSEQGSTSDSHSETSSDEEIRAKRRTMEQTAAKTAEATGKVSGSFPQCTAAWPLYPHKPVQYATFYQPIPLISYYLIPGLDKTLRPPPGFLLPQGQAHHSKIGKRHK
ncbi:maternal B9.10 protein-like [Carcharodon carcharias]|uniref:maternal B9.10 protein-like n=1 Tax=Carcharodon carcharias TaxID=13397 RepID=UPI001B7DADBF|nr:maternal B9.10 protein-like [Carcharodon carcharias]